MSRKSFLEAGSVKANGDARNFRIAIWNASCLPYQNKTKWFLILYYWINEYRKQGLKNAIAVQNYLFFNLEYHANPIVPKDKPATDIPQDKKFRKKVDSNKWITIKKGRITPMSNRITPRRRRRRGEFIKSSTRLYLYSALRSMMETPDKASKPRNVRARARNPVEIFLHTSLQWLWNNAGESGSPSAD